jgi:N-acetyl sugar amidotransferase
MNLVLDSRSLPIPENYRGKREYRICFQCVMDTSDSQISFDNEGVCDHCHSYREHVLPNWHTDERGKRALEKIVAKVKSDGKNRDFDCIMGMSGGADSSYMLHVAVKDFGLRPLVFHVDGGWNSQIGTNNIEVLIKGLGLDLYTEVINWQEMRDFQLAFFKSGVPHIDIPQDHAFIATLYNFAAKHKIKYILNGGNYSTECVRNPLEFFYYGTDMAQIRDIRRQYCTNPMRTYPFSSILRHKVYLRYIRRIQVIKPLNYFPYIKAEAMQFLKDTYGWIPYPQKHFESRFTRFFEGYWLPNKFGFDSRRVQYSSLILTGQMTRDQALQLLQAPALSDDEVRTEFEYIAKKLGISSDELQGYFDAPNKSYKDYKNQEAMFVLGAKILNWLGVERAIKR